ncbi:MAG: RHS repeat-associated core domain-containing protein [Thermoanaerobaculia bacterium]
MRLANEGIEARSEATPGAGDWAVTRQGYDENFNLVSIVQPEGETTLQTYDPRNLLFSVTRGAATDEASTETYVHDAEGNRTLLTNGRGFSHETAFDGFGRVKSANDPLGNRTAMGYDDGSSVVESARYDGGGHLLAETGSSFDLRGRPATASTWLWSGSDPTGARTLTSSTAYDAAGNAIASTDALGRTSTQAFDSAGRRVTATDAVGNRVEWELDRASHSRQVTMVEQVEGEGPVTTTVQAAHDALGRATTTTDPLGNVATTVYDARGNVRLAIDPEGHFTESTFDGPDRLTRTVRPEGISVDYAYDRSSRLTSYRDALNQTTSWSYDALGRARTTTYPDATQESVAYDAAGNATLLVDANGNQVTQIFDSANRMSSRSVVPGSGVEGPTAEIFAYDGLSRLTQVQSGTHVTSHTYDSLSRQTSETTNGKTTTYQRDDAGNVTQQVYPSGTSLTQTFDALNRQKTVATGGSALVSYGFRGGDLVASKSLGNGLAGGTTYDGARRPVRSTLGGANFEPFTERLAWSKRNLKTATQREDLNGRGYVVAYDGAGRLVEAAKAENPLDLAPNNSTPAAATVAALSESYGYSYDAAENLLEQRPERFAISAHQSSPSDGSGRNRPGSFAGQTLSWDGNGNLIRKGADHFAWDYRNRLTRVTRDGVGEIARYEYDAFNRLSKRTVGGEVQEWAWSGWQLLERYKNGQLAMRRTYGQGLDEVVRQESDSDGDGVLETVTIPVYDSIGNAVAITDESGKAIERYEYSPYGTRTIRVDLTPPVVEQLREADGQLLLEFSEEILLQRIEQAITGGTLTLRDTTDDEPVTITASQPVRDGKQKGRRLLLTPDPGAPPEANHAMLLHIEPSAMADLFENRSETAYEKAFVWLDADHVIEDTTPPRVELLLTKTGELELGWSEAIDAESASQRILLDGQTLTWITTPDGYTLKPDVAISATTHTLQVTGQLADLGGNAIAAPWSHSVTTGGTDRIVYERPDERITPTSTLDNLASFQGHITDPATGLVYMRNRWMDPEMGRFLSADPMGYPDGPSQYGFAGNSPQDRSDPLGLFQQDFHQGLTEYLARLAGFNFREAKLLGRAAQSPDCEGDPRNPINSGLLINSRALPPFGVGAFPKTQVSNAERAEAAMRLRTWHFPLTLTSEGYRVVKQSAEASEIYRRGIRDGDLWAFGSGLHVLEDSFSHSGKGSREFFDPVRAIYAQYGHPDERGGLFDASTDEPDKYPLLAIEAAAATFAALLEFRSQNDPSFDFDEFAARWEDYSRAPLLQFINSTREGRLEWLGDAHIYLDPE